MKNLLLIAHCPSANTLALRDAAISGIEHPDITNVNLTALSPLDATAENVLAADAMLLGSTENFGYMAGLIKDFFERIYYPCLEQKQGLPFAMYIRAGEDGTGTRIGIEKIITGLKWNMVQPPLICRGDFQDKFNEQCTELGMTIAAGLEAGIY